MTISQQLKIKIIADYLSGMKREDIAKKYGISTGSVSAIAEEFEEIIPDIHKIRAMMIKLNATGNNPKVFYHAIRLHNHIINLGLTIEKAEYILEIFQDYAFKNNYNISELIDAVLNAFNIAAKWGTDLEHLDQHMHDKDMVLQAKEDRKRKLENDIEFLPHKYNIKLAELQEYQSNKPTYQIFMNLVNELDIQTRINKLLEDEKKNLKIKVLERDKEIEMLNQLLSQQEKKAEGYYIDYQEDIANLNSIDCLVEDSNDIEDNSDSL